MYTVTYMSLKGITAWQSRRTGLTGNIRMRLRACAWDEILGRPTSTVRGCRKLCSVKCRKKIAGRRKTSRQQNYCMSGVYPKLTRRVL